MCKCVFLTVQYFTRLSPEINEITQNIYLNICSCFIESSNSHNELTIFISRNIPNEIEIVITTETLVVSVLRAHNPMKVLTYLEFIKPAKQQIPN